MIIIKKLVIRLPFPCNLINSTGCFKKDFTTLKIHINFMKWGTEMVFFNQHREFWYVNYCFYFDFFCNIFFYSTSLGLFVL